MILLIIAMAWSMIVLFAEIPAFIRYKNEEDFLLMVMSGLMLASCIVVLFAWRLP